MDRREDAKEAFDQAKNKVVQDQSFDQIQQRIESVGDANINQPSRNQLQSLIKLYSQGKFISALTDAKQLLKKFPNSANLYNIYGALNQGLSKLDEAVNAYNKAICIKPDYADAYNNLGTVLKEKGKLDRALEAYSKALSIKPDYAEAYNNMASALKKQGKLDEALMAYINALSIKPDYAEASFNFGNTLKEQGKTEEALEAYSKALSIKPDYAEACNNMASILKEQGKLDKAIETYKKALSIKPDYAEAYINMGNALINKGKLDKAIETYKKALSIKPDYAEAYNNLGNALSSNGRLKEAIKAYQKALSIKPDYAEALFNRSGSSQNLMEAIEWIEKCVSVSPNHVEANLILSALQFYNGNRSNFYRLQKSQHKEHSYMRSFNWIFSLPKLPSLYFHRWAFFDQMINLSKIDRPFYEFGVWRGVSFRYLIKKIERGYGFDTFEGLPEDWHNHKAGTYSSDSVVPKIDGGEFIVGKFEDTLPKFFADRRQRASIINFDADLYTSTICALTHAKPIIDQHTILIFDEFIMNKNWEQDEYKALQEFCNTHNYKYEVVAISLFTKQVAVKIIEP